MEFPLPTQRWTVLTQPTQRWAVLCMPRKYIVFIDKKTPSEWRQCKVKTIQLLFMVVFKIQASQ